MVTPRSRLTRKSHPVSALLAVATAMLGSSTCSVKGDDQLPSISATIESVVEAFRVDPDFGAWPVQNVRDKFCGVFSAELLDAAVREPIPYFADQNKSDLPKQNIWRFTRQDETRQLLLYITMSKPAIGGLKCTASITEFEVPAGK